MADWPEYELERLSGALLRVDLYEQRYLAVGEYPNVVNHLLRSASAACLSDREDEALRLVQRSARRVEEWMAAVRDGSAKLASLGDLACTRGFLSVAASPGPNAVDAARGLLALTQSAPSGSVQNARLVAAAILGDIEAVESAAKGCELSDAGLGLPLRKFVVALFGNDEVAMKKMIFTWLQEKMEATMTHEWGAYNEVPIEVSGALALAERRGRTILIKSNRVLTRFRADA